MSRDRNIERGVDAIAKVLEIAKVPYNHLTYKALVELATEMREWHPEWPVHAHTDIEEYRRTHDDLPARAQA